MVSLYLSKTRFADRRNSFSDAKPDDVLISTGPSFEGPKSFPISATNSKILLES
jgi:hypothetical protein